MSMRPFKNATPELGARTYVAETAEVIGAVRLGGDVSVWPRAVLRGDVNTITIGPRTNIQDGTIVHVTHDGPYTPGGYATEIGADVTIGHGCIIHACTIGNRCLIGMGAIVMDGAVIEDEVMLAAGSLVSPGKRLQSGYLYRGGPARQTRPLTVEEREMLQYSAAHYVRLKDRYQGNLQAPPEGDSNVGDSSEL
ncbi:MAG TPA: gamma carbonic anhydrase family protein [Gammaproteobacteria bacterium]|nr:gamma carbonic anhydrase family protein [Gammaproteobacteria bacterium]